VLGLACLAAAQEPPSFKQGLWQFTRTVEGTGQPKSTMARKVCTSPTEDMRRGREQSANSAYTVKIDSSGSVGGQTVTTKEELVAKRLGDCP
jgi:hypothetical protein